MSRSDQERTGGKSGRKKQKGSKKTGRVQTAVPDQHQAVRQLIDNAIASTDKAAANAGASPVAPRAAAEARRVAVSLPAKAPPAVEAPRVAETPPAKAPPAVKAPQVAEAAPAKALPAVKAPQAAEPAPAEAPPTVKAPQVAEAAPAEAPPAVKAPQVAEAAPAETARTAETRPVGLQTIASAYSDYTRKSLENARTFAEKLASARTLGNAVEAQTEFAKQAYETFVTDSRKIRDLYGKLFKQSLKLPMSPFDRTRNR